MKNITVFCLIALAGSAQGQSLEQRIASARGSVGFEFNTKAGVCGNGSSISISEDGSVGYSMSARRNGIHIGKTYAGDRSICQEGPARVVISKSGSAISAIDISVGGRDVRAETELGAIAAGEAAQYLLSIAPKMTDRSAEHAILGAAIADGASPWKRMMEIARDNNAYEGARKASLFWVSQEASTVATTGLGDVAMDDDADTKVRSDAIFYLGQRRNGEGIPALIRVVETSKSARLKKDAIFYLSQSRDPRALDLFEKLLAGR